jgi:hypothetical protein
MSWWDLGDDVLGDRPADAMKLALRTISTAREDRGEARLDLKHLLDGFAAALRDFDTSPESSFSKLAAKLKSGSEVESEGKGSADEEVARQFRRAFDQIQDAYEERFHRKPKLTELLKTLRFILGFEPSRFLELQEDAEIKEIIAKQ